MEKGWFVIGKMDKIEELLEKKKCCEATKTQVRALTDKSYKNVNQCGDDETNSELGTYGDAVLKLALCEIYFTKNIKYNDGLSKWCEQYETDEVLVKIIAKHYDLLDFLDFDKNGNCNSEQQKPEDYNHTGQKKDRHKYIATAMEACLAAIYIENGVDAAVEVVENWICLIDENKNMSNTNE